MSKSSKKCKKGEIEKSGYDRRGYKRQSYISKFGIRVPSTYIAPTYVAPTCIKDVGKPGKGPKTLPKLDSNIHLTKYGYNIHKSENRRHNALRLASKDFGLLPVLRRINLIRNYQANQDIKNIFSQDVEYMKKMYSKYKKKQQRGGNIQNIVESKYEIKKTCTNNTCKIVNYVYESHMIDDNQIVYSTLGKNDIDDIYNTSKLLCDITRDSIEDMIDDDNSYIIGIKFNDVLKGFYNYKIIDNSTVEIRYLCVEKGYNTALSKFIKGFFDKNKYENIIDKTIKKIDK